MNARAASAILLVAGLVPAGDYALAGGERRLLARLRASGLRIVHETCRDGNWDLVMRNADGSEPVNLTRTPHVDELYPKVSPHGRRIAFVAIEGAGRSRAWNLYCMDADGSNRALVAPHGRQPFWSPDGRLIAFAMGDKRTAPEGGYANKGLYFYDIESRALTEAPRDDLAGLLAPCFTPDGQWLVASVAEGMGFHHAIAAIRLHGKEIVPLAKAHLDRGRPLKNIYQCRPDISPDGSRIAWGKDDIDNRLGYGRRSMYIETAHIDLSDPHAPVTRHTHPVRVKWPQQTYHVDWSPDGRYLAFSQGPSAPGRVAAARRTLGRDAPGWNLRVVTADPPHTIVQITTDGLSNKEPDWVPVAPAKGRPQP